MRCICCRRTILRNIYHNEPDDDILMDWLTDGVCLSVCPTFCLSGTACLASVCGLNCGCPGWDRDLGSRRRKLAGSFATFPVFCMNLCVGIHVFSGNSNDCVHNCVGVLKSNCSSCSSSLWLWWRCDVRDCVVVAAAGGFRKDHSIIQWHQNLRSWVFF